MEQVAHQSQSSNGLPANLPYALSDKQSMRLSAMVAVSKSERIELMASYLQAHGQAALLQLLAEFFGLAVSVAENCHQHAIDLLTQEGMHPYEAEKVNMPSLLGALNGVTLANQVNPKGACHGCAFRLGSIANQCHSTTLDAQWCQTDVHRFMCHARGVLPDGTPTVRCVGDSKAQRALVRDPAKAV